MTEPATSRTRSYTDAATDENIQATRDQYQHEAASLWKGINSQAYYTPQTDWDVLNTSQHDIYEAWFTPIVDLSHYRNEVHPLALTFAVIFDLPLFRRCDNSGLDLCGLSGYYVDEQMLMRVLKPIQRRRSSMLHALDSHRHIDPVSMPDEHNNPTLAVSIVPYCSQTSADNKASSCRAGGTGATER